MPDDLAYLALLLIPAGLFAGAIRGFAGFGGPLLLIPLLNLQFRPATTIIAVLIADMLASVQLLPEARRQADLKAVALLVCGSLLTIFVGSFLLTVIDSRLMKRAVSAVILALGFLLLTGWRYSRPLQSAGYIGVGAMGGLVMGAAGIAAAVPLFLNASSDTGVRSRAHFILWVFVASLLVCIPLILAEGISKNTIAAAALLLPTYSFGVLVGSKMVCRTSDGNIRRAVLSLVVIVATAGLVF